MKIAPFLENHVQQHTPQPDWESIKTEKWPIAYVCAFIIWLKCRAMLPFALGDRYGPKQACKHQQRMLVAGRKIFRTTQRQTSCSQKHNFWEFQTTQSQKLPLSGYQNVMFAFEWSEKFFYRLPALVVGVCKLAWGHIYLPKQTEASHDTWIRL